MLKVTLPVSGSWDYNLGDGVPESVVYSQHFTASLAKIKWINEWRNVAAPKQNENIAFRSGKPRSFCFPSKITWKGIVFILLLKSPAPRHHPHSHPCQSGTSEESSFLKCHLHSHLIYASYLQSELKASTSATPSLKTLIFKKREEKKESDYF